MFPFHVRQECSFCTRERVDKLRTRSYVSQFVKHKTQAVIIRRMAYRIRPEFVGSSGTQRKTLGEIENVALFLRLVLPSTLIRHENAAFPKRFSNGRNLRTPAFQFLTGRIVEFWNSLVVLWTKTFDAFLEWNLCFQITRTGPSPAFAYNDLDGLLLLKMKYI